MFYCLILLQSELTVGRKFDHKFVDIFVWNGILQYLA